MTGGCGEPLAGIVLAAGSSLRTGAIDKLLVEVDGRPMVRRVVETALAAGLDPVVVVTSNTGAAVRAAVAGLPVTIVENEAAAGLSTSLRRGAAAVPAAAAGVAVLLGDMPWVEPATVRALIHAFDPSEGRAVCVPIHEGRRGNPVVWAARFFPEIAELEGDEGARALLTIHAAEVHVVAVDDPGILRDVDTPEDLAVLRRTSAPSSPNS